MIGDESKNMGDSVGECYRERSEIKVMNDHYCKLAKVEFYFILQNLNFPQFRKILLNPYFVFYSLERVL